MCVVAMAWKVHPRWMLVLAGNRDEFHARPAAGIARWPDKPGLIGGQDLQSGGMWLGVNEAGRCAVVTNVRSEEGPDPALASRGALIHDWLAGEGRYAAADVSDLDGFNGLLMLAVTHDEAMLLTNRPAAQRMSLHPGIHALSNALPEVPWPRKAAVAGALADWLAGEACDPAALFTPLSQGREHPTEPGSGDQAPAFLAHEIYGTRCSTVIAIDHQGAGQIIERRFGPDGVDTGETKLGFDWINARPF